MPANQVAKRRKWFKEKCEQGCELCGRKIPASKNNGLIWSHIVSKPIGRDEEVNCLALCPTCSNAFDMVIKPAIFKACKKYSTGLVPNDWENGENRVAR